MHLKLIFHCDAKFALPPTQNLKFALPQTPNPNASQWNIGCDGSPTQNFRVGRVHFFFFLGDDFIRVGSHFSVEYGLNCLLLLLT